jgi:hypothetical protein
VLARFGPPALVALLIAATGVAFAVTERLKLQPSPIFRTHVTKQFSPTCGCKTSQAWVVFSLRHSDQITLSVLAPGGQEVRQLVGGKDVAAGPFRSIWNGRDEQGRLLPDGNYRVRVHLARQRWTIPLPNVIRLDKTPPKITTFAVSPRTVSPDGDHRGDAVHISYRVNERASIILLVDGKQNEKTKLRASRSGKFDWKGMIDHSVLQGWHDLTLKAVDAVGNESEATAPISVRVRILRLRPTLVRVRRRQVFTIRISTDREQVRWKFAGRSGRARYRSLTLRAPATPGRYRLIARSGHYAAGTLVVVR